MKPSTIWCATSDSAAVAVVASADAALVQDLLLLMLLLILLLMLLLMMLMMLLELPAHRHCTLTHTFSKYSKIKRLKKYLRRIVVC